jgi:hypothetical protein
MELPTLVQNIVPEVIEQEIEPDTGEIFLDESDMANQIAEPILIEEFEPEAMRIVTVTGSFQETYDWMEDLNEEDYKQWTSSLTVNEPQQLDTLDAQHENALSASQKKRKTTSPIIPHRSRRIPIVKQTPEISNKPLAPPAPEPWMEVIADAVAYVNYPLLGSPEDYEPNYGATSQTYEQVNFFEKDIP